MELNNFKEFVTSEVKTALNHPKWKRYRNFTVLVSSKGLPNRVVVYPTSTGYPTTVNPMAFDCFPIRRANLDWDLNQAFIFFEKRECHLEVNDL